MILLVCVYYIYIYRLRMGYIGYEPLTMPGMLQVYLGNGIGIWGLMLGPSV